jgi:hypothetical protein
LDHGESTQKAHIEMDKSIKNFRYRRQRMVELFRPIEMQILMTDDTDDLIMLATLMLTSGKDILLQRIGREKTKKMIDNLNL